MHHVESTLDILNVYKTFNKVENYLAPRSLLSYTPLAQLQDQKGQSQRDINCFINRRAYMSTARPQSNIPLSAIDRRQDMAVAFALGMVGEVIGRTDNRLADGLLGKLVGAAPSPAC